MLTPDRFKKNGGNVISARSTQLKRKASMLALMFSLFLLSVFAPMAQAKLRVLDSHPAVLLNTDMMQGREISSDLLVYPDSSATAMVHDIRTLPRSDFFALEDIRFSEDTTYWMHGRVRVSQRSSEGQQARLTGTFLNSQWRLVLPGTRIKSGELFVSNRDGVMKPVLALNDRNLVFPIEIRTDATVEFYLKIKPKTAFNSGVQFWQAQAYELHKRKSILGWGLFFGSVFALFLYNLFVFIALKESGYFYLSGFLGAAFLLTLVNENFLVLLGINVPSTNYQPIVSVLQCVVLLFACAFSRFYLVTQQRFPAIDRTFQVVMVAALVLAVVSYQAQLSQFTFKLLFTLLSATFFLPAVVASLQISDRSSRFYLVGWALFVSGYGIFQLGDVNIIPSNTITAHGKEMALCLLGVFLSLGIAAQIQRERSSKSEGLVMQKQTMLELKYAEEQIQKKVLRDTLLEYPDMQALRLVANQSLQQIQQGSETLTLVLVDLLHLDRVQSQLGHTARNELVTRATRRLSIVLRSIVGVVPVAESEGQYLPMSVFQNGQYGFLLRGMDSVKVNMAVDEVEAAMQKPFYFQGMPLEPGVCFGVSSSEAVDTFEGLFDHCSASLNADKKRAQNRLQDVQFLNGYNPRNIGLINQLREAIQENQLTLYFQSTFALKSHKVCGIEVLCRWEGLKDQTVSPHEIFYLAEVGGFVSELTLKVIENAIEYYKQALGDEQSKVIMSINLSPKCIRDGHFLEQVAVALEQNAFSGDCLAFEIKESSIIEDPSITRESLNQIRSMGIGLTIDEFGAAYSNPSYLSSLPVNSVKLDPRMVAQLDNHSNKAAVLDVIEICQKHKIKLVVHGVEDESTLLKLAQMGCGFAQGHYLAEPVPANQYGLPKRDNSKSRYLPNLAN